MRTHVRAATDPKGLAAHNLERIEVQNRHTGERLEKFGPPEVVAAHRARLADLKAERDRKEAADRAAKGPKSDRTWAEFGRDVQDGAAKAVKKTLGRVTVTLTEWAARKPKGPGPGAGEAAKGKPTAKAGGAEKAAGADKAGDAGRAGRVDPRPPVRRTRSTGRPVDWFLDRHAPTPFWRAHGRALLTGLRHGSLDRAERAFKEERSYERLKPRTVLRVEDPRGELTPRDIACLRRVAARDRATFEYAGPPGPDKHRGKPGPDGTPPKPPPEPDLGRSR